MKLPFGFEITRRKKLVDICYESEPVAAGEIPGLFYRQSGSGILYSFRKPSQSLSILWPEPPDGMNPELAKLALAGLVLKVDRMLNGSHFDICPITSAVSDFEIQVNEDSQIALEILRSIHCIDYHKLPKGLRKRIPELLSCVFSSGAYSMSKEGSEKGASEAPVDSISSDEGARTRAAPRDQHTDV